MRICTECNKEIASKRLEIIPNATKCVSCQSKNDVYIKRYDDSARDGEIQVSSFFFRNPVFESAINRLKGSYPEDNTMEYTQPILIKPIIYTGLSEIFTEDTL